jgi:hypothetical protein
VLREQKQFISRSAFLKNPPQTLLNSVRQRQTRISEWIPTYQSVEERAKQLFVYDIDLNGLINTLTIRFRTGQQKRSLLLNRVILIKKQEY